MSFSLSDRLSVQFTNRWPALSCALFIRIFDALIIGSQVTLLSFARCVCPPSAHSSPPQAIHLDMKDTTHAASYSIPKMKSSSVSFSAASSPVNVAASSAVCDSDSGNFISEFGPGLCIIMRLLARFVEVSHSEVSASIASSGAAHAEETFTAGGADLGMAHAMQVALPAWLPLFSACNCSPFTVLQGYGSWLLYRASQVSSLVSLNTHLPLRPLPHSRFLYKFARNFNFPLSAVLQLQCAAGQRSSLQLDGDPPIRLRLRNIIYCV